MSLIRREVGRYRVLDVLGTGATSVVYRASDPKLSREVAVKVLHPHLARSPELRARIEQEARAVARLRHPNILEVYDSGVLSEDEGAYVVTELVTGRTLRERIQGPLRPPELAAALLLVVARALAHAHAAGIVHRDLKPENLMLRHDGVLKVMDFGVARILDSAGVDRLTTAGALVGTPAHMAPEVIEGLPARPASDVFSLGTVLYLWTTGTLPFTAPTAAATLHRVLTATPSDPRALRPELSDGLSELVLRCLERDPEKRYADAGALADALAAHLGELDVVDASGEVARAFSTPVPDGGALEARVVDAQLRRAEEALGEGRSARALAWVDQVLRRAPEEPRALALFERASGPGGPPSGPQHPGASRLGARRVVRMALVAGALFVGALGAHRGLREARPGAGAGAGATAATEPRGAAPSGAAGAPSEVASGTDRSAAAASSALKAPRAPGDPADPSPDVLELPRPDATRPTAPTPTAVFSAPHPSTGQSQRSTSPGPRAVRDARAGTSVATPGTNAPLVSLEVRIRPWGALAVDEGSPSDEELALHRLRLPAGRHRFRVTCREFCSMNGSAREVEVLEGMDPLLLVAPLRPAVVRFEGYPLDATVSLGGPERAAADTAVHPLEVAMPPEGAREMRLRVVYEVKRGGVRIDAGERWVPPGGSLTISPGGP